MEFKRRIAEFSLDHARQVALALAAFTLVWASFIPWAKVDTVPETMLSEHEAARIFNEQAAIDFALNQDGNAENASGRRMLVSTAIAVPLAMLTILILNAVFFRRLALVLVPMLIAVAAMLSTMGMLTGLRLPMHLVSTTIPIFLMPIAVVGPVCVLSEFFKKYTKEKGPRQTVIDAMGTLLASTLCVSLILATSFALLILTPIPSVRAFGLLVAVGILIAWIFAVAFVPAYVTLLDDSKRENVAAAFARGPKETRLTRALYSMSRFTAAASKPILLGMVIPIVVAAYGVARIGSRSIPETSVEIDQRLVHSRTAYLVLEDGSEPNVTVEFIKALREGLLGTIERLAVTVPQARDVLEPTDRILVQLATKKTTKAAFLTALSRHAHLQRLLAAQEVADVWSEVADFFAFEGERLKLFQQPETLRYVANLEDHVESTGLIVRSNSVADIVRRTSREPIGGGPENHTFPDSIEGVAESLRQFQNSRGSDELRHLVTDDFAKANIRLQLKSGNSRDMKTVAAAVERYFTTTPPPMPIRCNWAGRAYVNLIWRQKMAWGTLRLLGALAIMLIAVATPIAVRRRSFASMTPAQRDIPGRASSLLASLLVIAAVLLIIDQFSRASFNGFIWISIISSPILAALSASLVRRQVDWTLFAQQAKATAV